MKKQKIGNGYYQAGYGRGFKKNRIIWLINGKAYVKDSQASPFQTDIEGHVMVNSYHYNDIEYFAEVGLISEHQNYKS
jgi:hypothetical protein